MTLLYLIALKSWQNNTNLEPCSFMTILLIMKHCFENLFMAIRNETDSTQNFQDCDLCSDVFACKALSDDFNTIWMSKDVRPSLLKMKTGILYKMATILDLNI